MNVSCNHTSLQYPTSLMINRGKSATCSDDDSGESEVFSLSKNISSLLSLMQDFDLPALFEIKQIEMQNTNKVSCKDSKDQDVLAKKPRSLIITQISIAIGFTFHLLDTSHLKEMENKRDHLNTCHIYLYWLEFCNEGNCELCSNESAQFELK